MSHAEYLIRFRIRFVFYSEINKIYLPTAKDWFRPVLHFLKWRWTVDRTAVTVFCSPRNFQSFPVLVRSGCSLFPVLWPDFQTLCITLQPDHRLTYAISKWYCWPFTRSCSKCTLPCWQPHSIYASAHHSKTGVQYPFRLTLRRVDSERCSKLQQQRSDYYDSWPKLRLCCYSSYDTTRPSSNPFKMQEISFL